MRAGTLKYKITLYSRSLSRNALKEVIDSYVTYRTVRADVKYLNGSEIILNSQEQSTSTLIFTIRYDTGIDEHMVIEYEGIKYNIRTIEHIRKSMTRINATKMN